MNKPLSFNDSRMLPPVPGMIINTVEDLYDSRGELRYVSKDALGPLIDSPIQQSHLAARRANDSMAGINMQMAVELKVSERVGEMCFFEVAAAMDMTFQSDLMVAIYEAVASSENPYDRLRDDFFLRLASPWAKLQFVLAAEHYQADSDVLGLVVGNAWKEGRGQSIMTANFDFLRCSRWLEASSERGLNAIHAAPKKPIGKTLFRGGSLCPSLPHGMAWTEDRDQAVFFAERLSKGAPVIVSTHTADNRVLVRYEHESEVVLPHDPNRPFEVEFI